MQLSVVGKNPELPKHERHSGIQLFDDFWRLYPRKIARAMAEKCFSRLTMAERAQAIEAMPRHIAYWRSMASSIQFVPHASTWLNQRRFEDELECDLPAAIPCKWTGCKSVGMVAWGSAHYCEAHILRLKKGETP